MRIGYGIGHENFIEYMHRVKPVFSLTKLSYIAALATLDDTEYIKTSTQLSIESREFLYNKMSKFPELNVLNSFANYILVGIRNTGMNSNKSPKNLWKMVS